MLECTQPAAQEVASQRATLRTRTRRGIPTEFLRRAEGADHLQVHLLVEPLVECEAITRETQYLDHTRKVFRFVKR